MASLERLTARIDTVEADPSRWQLSVEYALRMHYWETGAWFSEVVEVCAGRAEEPDSVRPLLRLTLDPWRLEPSRPLDEPDFYVTNRAVPPQEFAGQQPPELFVRVRVSPKSPSAFSACVSPDQPTTGSDQ
jgi:hypothetical protein